jgi:hypothetical protein
LEASVKDIYQVLREKELAVARVRQEVEALRFCAPMLSEGSEPGENTTPSTGTAPANRWPAEVDTRGSSNPYHN